MKKLVLSLAIAGLSLSGDCFAYTDELIVPNKINDAVCNIAKQEISGLAKSLGSAALNVKSAAIDAKRDVKSAAINVRSAVKKHKKALCVAAVFAAAGALDYHMVSSGKWDSGVLPYLLKKGFVSLGYVLKNVNYIIKLSVAEY